MKNRTVLTIIFFFVSLLIFAQDTEEQKDARRREFISDFIATYQAAYEKKEIDYISQFFSTDALIITETKQLLKCGEEIAPMTTKKRSYKLIVEDKQQYIARLKDIFDKNFKIKLSIAGLRITRHSLYPEIYGVSFLQIWKDQDDGDNLESQMPGYVFLMIDFKGREQQPIIHVRTWQPEDNVKSPKDKFSLFDFRIYDF
ncbi:MAG: hypothetical protein NC115_10570 [Bacteroidales bacterium]|nr:hypothetical protein [Bacteroides sp.]MCM1198781.1 hypothetical protein [Clostridium sp.]MCM1503090.1 hypothetical protein [Bacteroidales bacterium]